MPTKQELELQERVTDLEQVNQRLQRSLKRVKDRQGELVDAVMQAARDGIVAAGPVRKPKSSAGGRKAGKPEVALLHLTDWQLGKETADYNSQVCVDRVMQLVEKTVSITGIQRAAHPVDEIHVMLGGDMIENTGIFPGQAFEVDSRAITQVFTASRLIADVMSVLLASFNRVVVSEVYGNHGRIGRKGDMAWDDNLDRVVYEIARTHTASQTRLKWQIPDKWFSIIEIGAYRGVLVHGDQIKSFGGTPAFAIMKRATQWEANVLPEHRDLYLGHFHQSMELTKPSGGRIYMTPSTESESVYAEAFVGAHGRPGQRLHFIDPRRGRVTAQYLLEVE